MCHMHGDGSLRIWVYTCWLHASRSDPVFADLAVALSAWVFIKSSRAWVLVSIYLVRILHMVAVACKSIDLYGSHVYTFGCSCMLVDLEGSEFILLVAVACPVDLYGSDLSLYFELQLQVVGSDWAGWKNQNQNQTIIIIIMYICLNTYIYIYTHTSLRFRL